MTQRVIDTFDYRNATHRKIIFLLLMVKIYIFSIQTLKLQHFLYKLHTWFT